LARETAIVPFLYATSPMDDVVHPVPIRTRTSTAQQTGRARHRVDINHSSDCKVKKEVVFLQVFL
jgi:hypothetical protein